MTVDGVLHSTHSNGVPGGGLPPPLYTPPEHALSDGKDVICTCMAAPEMKDFSAMFQSDYVSFSAKTCIELLPSLTNEQLNYEVNFAKSLGHEFDFRSTRNPAPKTLNSALTDYLVGQITPDMDSLVGVIDHSKPLRLIENISRLSEDLVLLRNELVQSNTTTQCEDCTSSLECKTHTHACNSDSFSSLYNYNTPVCVFDNVYFSHLGISDLLCCTDIDFSVVGGRKTAYFGDFDYSYSNTTHKKCDYPNNTVIDTIFDTLSDKLQLPDFNKENYTCLITLYENGENFLPFHSDNERCIVDNSNIVTVSLGAERDIVFKSILGDEIRHTLHHGSVNIMSSDSQALWEHSIPKTDCTLPRISLTFRKLAPIKSIPPVHRPTPSPSAYDNVSPPSPQPKTGPRRVLLLTDSIHARFPSHIFPNDVVCVRKINYQLTDIDKYKPIFSQVDLVLVTCGVNDISRYDKTGRFLADFVCDRFDEYARLFPATTFVFNSILSTNFDWLNRDIAYVNDRVFRLSVRLDNLWFLDTHQVFNEVNFDPIDRAHGIHLTLTAKRYITPIMRTCILDLLTESPVTSVHWPLRPEFVHVSRSH